jgi:hypothetical protein
MDASSTSAKLALFTPFRQGAREVVAVRHFAVRRFI